MSKPLIMMSLGTEYCIKKEISENLAIKNLSNIPNIIKPPAAVPIITHPPYISSKRPCRKKSIRRERPPSWSFGRLPQNSRKASVVTARASNIANIKRSMRSVKKEHTMGAANTPIDAGARSALARPYRPTPSRAHRITPEIRASGMEAASQRMASSNSPSNSGLEVGPRKLQTS